MSDYLDAELAPARRARMERHLSECVKCRRLLADLRRTVAALNDLSAPHDRVDALAIAASVRGRVGETD